MNISSPATIDAPHDVPRRDVLRAFERLVTPFLILACIVSLSALALSFRPARPFIIIWVILAVAYLVIRYGLRYPAWIFLKQTVLLRTTIGVVSIVLLQVFLRFVGYGQDGDDPYALWLMFIVPLITASRFGTSHQWLLILGSASGALLGQRLFGAFSGVHSWPSGVQEWASRIWTNHELRIGASQIIVLSLIGGAVHTLVRLMQMDEARLRAGRKMTGQLASQRTFPDAYREAAQSIQSFFSPQAYVFVLLWDGRTQRLRIVGAAGKPIEVWRNIELRKEQGITGKALSQGEIINVRDVLLPEWNDTYYSAEGLEDIRSEIAVPIRYRGKVIGVLDVESQRVGEFDDKDQALLEGFAESLAVSFGHFLSLDERVASAHCLVMQTIEAGSEHTHLGSWFADIAQSASSCLGTSGLALIRLAPGTGYPLLPFAVWPKGLSRLADPHRIPKEIPLDSLLWHLLDEWQFKHWNPENWKEWNTQADAWFLSTLQAMSAKTLVFVPIGTVENPLAALFVAYSHDEMIGDIQRLTLTTFATALEKSYQTLTPLHLEPRRTGSAVHEVLVPCTQKLLATISTAKEASSDSISVRLHLDEMEKQCRELRERVRRVTVSDRYDLSAWELEVALKRTASEFQELQGVAATITFSGVGDLEDEPLYTRQVLYRVIVEAIANAIEHGLASLVEVAVWRDARAINVQVRDDGVGLPVNVSQTSPYGIFHLRRILRREMGARLKLHNIDPHGVCMLLHLPVRPRKQ